MMDGQKTDEGSKKSKPEESESVRLSVTKNDITSRQGNDDMIRDLVSHGSDLLMCLQNIGSWDFDIFK